MAGQVKKARTFTVDEYLAYERAALERHEYFDGRIYEMESADERQAIITVNLMAELGNQLKGRDSSLFSPNMKVRCDLTSERATTVFCTYADLMVAGDQLRFHDAHTDVLLNPTVIIEVLSATTEAYKRGAKFRRYREGIPTCTDYLLVSTAEPLIEHFTINQDKLWMIAATVMDLAESLPLASIDCTLKMAEVYDRIDFPN
ncbi:MAG TPA: Uma2 family endonuclease [Blastocatellia bacterium]|nr:Uma2 family endonuclease [Blastocatellia bacterium]